MTKKQPQFKDERVEQARMKIYSEMLILIYYAICISFCVKVLVFSMPLQACLMEYVILIGVPVYQAIRTRQLNVVLLREEHNYLGRSLVVCLVLGIAAFSYVLWKNGGFSEGLSLSPLISIAAFCVVFLLLRVGFVKLEQSRQKRLNAAFDEDEK